jgi:lysyl-tRNA synthetase class 2
MSAKQLAFRARMLAETRAFFASRGYLEVETPALVPCPGLDLHLDAFEVPSAPPQARWLSTSPEHQMKRLLATREPGHERIFQIARAFRRGEEGSRHNPEFTILEFYRANAGASEVMKDTEQLVARLTGGAAVVDGRAIDTRPPVRRLTVADAFVQYARIAEDEVHRLANEDEDRFFRLLVDEVEPRLAELDHAVFLTEYPIAFASLARPKPGDPRVAERFELYVAGVELCNGFGELTDAAEQRRRFVRDQGERRKRGLAVYPLDERFLDALRTMPPAGGNAIGFDRLCAIAAGTSTIEPLMAFTVADL